MVNPGADDNSEQATPSGVLVSGISKTFQTPQGPVPVLRKVSFAVAPGQAMALTGDSGSGKSTLLHMLGGLERPDTGTIQINGKAIQNLSDPALSALRRRTTGLVFQQFNLIPSLTVHANLAFQARLAGRFREDGLHRLAGQLGLSDLLMRYPEQLSGGQQQRVAIGRTLLARPALVLADEPTGNLDAATGEQVLELLLKGVAETGSSLLMVTHSLRLAARLDQRRHLHNGALTTP